MTQVALIHTRLHRVFCRQFLGQLHPPLVIDKAAKPPFIEIATALDIAKGNDLLYRHLLQHSDYHEVLGAFADPPLADIVDLPLKYCISRNFDTQPRLEIL